MFAPPFWRRRCRNNAFPVPAYPTKTAATSEHRSERSEQIRQSAIRSERSEQSN